MVGVGRKKREIEERAEGVIDQTRRHQERYKVNYLVSPESIST